MIETPGFSLRNTGRDTLEILSEERERFSLKNSQIDLREEMQMPEFKGSKIRKTASLAGEMTGMMKESDSVLLNNESSTLLKN